MSEMGIGAGASEEEIEEVFKLGQYFTKKKIVRKLVNLIFEYKPCSKKIKILEPSYGTGNFIEVLKNRKFYNIEGCEIDEKCTSSSQDFFKCSDFFKLSLENKYDLVVGNPPFTKYNLPESYYHIEEYEKAIPSPDNYIPSELLRKRKIRRENAFILKSIKHLKEDGSIAFVLPISFFIQNKNNRVKEKILEQFSTVIIYQNNKTWFDYDIPCCFGIFANTETEKGKIILLYEDGKERKKNLEISKLKSEELIPRTYLYRANNNLKGTSLSKFLSKKPVKYKKSYEKNNISASNILEKDRVPEDGEVSNYKLAVCRVGNASVGRAGLINIEEDILNDMFYVFDFKEEYRNNRDFKESLVKKINKNQEHFKNLTDRVGSKSIKKGEILEFKIKI